MRTTAAVLDSQKSQFTVEEVEIDEPRAGEVLVRLIASGVCHTDAVAQQGDLPFPAPGVLGHEGVGRIEALGDGVTGHEIGDTVMLGWPWCGRCRNCLAGQPRYCMQLAPLLIGGGRTDGSTSLRKLDGSPLHSHFFGQSSFAHHAIVDPSSLVPISTTAPTEAVGVLACGIATGAGAVLNTLQLGPGDSLVVFGGGAVGLAAVMAARLTPTTTIVVVEPNPVRRELALKLGATEVIDPGAVDVVPTIHEICKGTADAALDCTGIPAVIRQTIDSVGMLGTAVLIGAAPAGAEFSADHLTTLWGKRIVGTLGGESQSPRFVPALLALHDQGRFPFTDLIQYFPLTEINEAMEASKHGDVVKPVLRLSESDLDTKGQS
ncbi:NAD(P)-dependent alcohol dehydrogenase [Nocardioides sp. NPDC006273]|uniref:NAD(P)-dependent alcohol dehydrogenase n=1 Tax=Nocardioides sp. NPDC006273 TaxID=3155598 RepID=UPI0033B429C8